jgi:hypothetical protein
MENEELKYDASAIIIINESDSVYDDAKPKVLTAQDVSQTMRSMKRTSKELMELKVKVDTVRDYLLENYQYMDDHAQEIADLLDLEMTKEVSVTVKVEFAVELAIKPNEDIGDIIDSLSFSISHCEEVTDYTEGDVDWDES